MIIVLTPESPIIRSVFARCVLDQGHFMWTGGTSKGGGKSGQSSPGYPTVWVPELKKSIRGHRLIFAAFHGMWEVPIGYHREHVCNRSLCLNPACMELVSAEENARRKTWRDQAAKEGRPLICPSCQQAGDESQRLQRKINKSGYPATDVRVASAIGSVSVLHAHCLGETWCDCQHKINIVPATAA